MLYGVGASPGLAMAAALRYKPEKLTAGQAAAGSVQAEQEAFEAAVQAVKAESRLLCEKARREAGPAEMGIFEAHIEILEDEESILSPILEAIEGGKSAAQAVQEQFDQVISILSSLDDELISARSSDFEDIKQQLLCRLLRVQTADLSHLTQDVIVVAHELTPTDTMKMDLSHIKGFVTEVGGTTSHTAILARALGIPTVVSCAGALEQVADGVLVLLDGGQGTVNPAPTQAEQQQLRERQEQLHAQRQALLVFRDQPTISADGHSVQLLANIASPQECGPAMENGGEGVGLFRSEFLYMENSALPDEEAQYRAYASALRAARGKPVTIRTLDAGGDKAVPSLGIPKEENPFLGCRAVRLCLDRPELFQTQLRALYRAGTEGPLQIMFPMISSLDELRQAKAAAAQAREELDRQGIPRGEQVKLGMMVEVPAAAVLADVFAREVDFFSIGTNDLVQYTLAVDRGNDTVARLYTHYHPAVVQLIHRTIEAAHRNGIPCCMCGEAAGDSQFIPLLLGLGLDSFSMSPSRLLEVRKRIAGLSFQRCRQMAAQALEAETAEELEKIAAAINETEV